MLGSTITRLKSEEDQGIHSNPFSPMNQRKIARILTTLDNLIENTEALIAKYQAIKQGIMHDLFSRGVDARGHLRPPRTKPPTSTDNPNWAGFRRSGCHVGLMSSLGATRSPKIVEASVGRFTTPYLRVANVFDGFIDYIRCSRNGLHADREGRYSLLPGDVLLNEGQSLELVGRTAIYTEEPGRFCFQNTLILPVHTIPTI